MFHGSFNKAANHQPLFSRNETTAVYRNQSRITRRKVERYFAAMRLFGNKVQDLNHQPLEI
jgi:hypothetical protein